MTWGYAYVVMGCGCERGVPIKEFEAHYVGELLRCQKHGEQEAIRTARVMEASASRNFQLGAQPQETQDVSIE